MMLGTRLTRSRMAMSEVDDIETVRRARIVADALVEGAVDAMVELVKI